MESEMSDAKFTKGEWAILPAEEDKEYLRIRGTALGRRYKIANVIDLKAHHNGMIWCERERAESAANANLIKTAPEMYAELEDLEAWLKYNDDYRRWHKRVKDLLVKARGEL
tara:strand:- start:42 stop:377 length:336 start_codon:yes stop_codon:yes gene_type:complete